MTHRLFAVLAGIGSCLVISSPASALQYKTGSSKVIPSGEIATQKVKCPPGSHVVSGGQFIFSGQNEVRLTRSIPYDSQDNDNAPDDGWKTSAAGYAPGGGTLAVTAICDDRLPAYRTTKAKRVGTNASGVRELNGVARCPKGTRTLGGGAQISGAWNAGGVLSHSNPHPVGSNRQDKGWEATALDFIGGPSSFPTDDVKVTTICGEQRPVYVVAEVATPPNSFGEAFANCPSGTDLVGGGAWLVQLRDHFLTISTPFDDGKPDQRPDDGWYAEADSQNSTFSLGLRAYAICLD